MALTTCQTCGCSYDPAKGKCPACTYEQATALKARAASFGDFETASKLFLSVGEYKDAAAQAAQCQAAAEDCNREATYNLAVKRQGVDQTSWQGKADLMRSIAGYRDADTLAEEYQAKADALAAEAANALREKEEERQKDAALAHSDHKRRRKFLLIGIAAAAVVLTAILVVSIVVMPSIQYKKAVALYDEADYTAAAKAFAAVAPYGDSEQYLALSYYRLGMMAVKNGDDLTAIGHLLKAGTVEDAPAQMQAAKGRLYDAAQVALQNGEISKADDLFDAADDYEDAKAYRQFCRALRIWNGDPNADTSKMNLEKAKDVLLAKLSIGTWCRETDYEKIVNPRYTVEKDKLLVELNGVTYTVEMYSLTKLRLIGSGPLAGAYEQWL